MGLLTSASHFKCKLLRKKKTVPASVLSNEQGSLLGSGQGVVIDLGEYKKQPNTVRSDHNGVRDTSDVKVKNGERGGGVGQGGGGGVGGDRAGAGAGTGLNGNITGLNTSTEDDPPTPLRRSRSLRNIAMFSRRHSFSCIPSSSCTTLQHESDDMTPRTVCGVESRSSSHPHAHSHSHSRGRTNNRLNGDLSYDDDDDDDNGGVGCSGGVGCGGGREGWRSSRSQRAVSLSRASHDTDTLHSSTTSSTVTRRRTTPHHTAPIKSPLTEIPSKISLNSSKSDNSSRQSSFTSLKMKFNMDSGKSNIEKTKRRKAKRRKRVRYCRLQYSLFFLSSFMFYIVNVRQWASTVYISKVYV